MTEAEKKMKKYTKAVKRKLNLPSDVKKRVMTDFTSSIQSRKEAGKTDEEIYAELGTPADVAADLNEQMKEFAYIKSPWRWACFALIIVCSLVLLYKGGVGLLAAMMTWDIGAAVITMMGVPLAWIALDFVTEEHYRSGLSDQSSASAVNIWLQNCDKLNGLIGRETHLLGFDDFALSKLTVLEGDISKLNDPDKRYIAAVYRADDYGNALMDTHWAKVGDTITIRHVEQWQYYDWFSGQPIASGADSSSGYKKSAVYRDVEYEVAALVIVPHALGYRYYSPDPWVLSSEVFIADTNTSSVMLYAFDTTDEANDSMGTFLKNQTEYGYESKQDLAESFYSLRDMFTALGGVLCIIIGFVGMLNFLNAILTGIFARKREFAVLQAIGMTGHQLKTMLVWEGLFQTLGSLLFSAGLCVITAPILKVALEAMFWFFSYRFTITPVFAVMPIFAILGITLPLIAHHIVSRNSIVDRLREK